MEEKKNQKKKFSIRICVSQKSCGDDFGPYIWERMCNEHSVNPEEKSFEAGQIEFEKSECQGACKRKSNVQVRDLQKKETTAFHYMNPIKMVKLLNNLKNGANPKNIKRL